MNVFHPQDLEVLKEAASCVGAAKAEFSTSRRQDEEYEATGRGIWIIYERIKLLINGDIHIPNPIEILAPRCQHSDGCAVFVDEHRKWRLWLGADADKLCDCGLAAVMNGQSEPTMEEVAQQLVLVAAESSLGWGEPVLDIEYAKDILCGVELAKQRARQQRM